MRRPMRRMHVLAGIVAAVLAASLLPAHAQELDPLMPIPGALAHVPTDLELGTQTVPVDRPVTTGDLADLTLRIHARGDLRHCRYEYLEAGNWITGHSFAAIPRLRVTLADGTASVLTPVTANGAPGDYARIESCQPGGDHADFGYDLAGLPDGEVDVIELVDAHLDARYLLPAGAEVDHAWTFSVLAATLPGGEVAVGSGVGWGSQQGKGDVPFSARGTLRFVTVEAPERPGTPAPGRPTEPPTPAVRAGSATAVAAPARPVTAAPKHAG